MGGYLNARRPLITEGSPEWPRSPELRTCRATRAGREAVRRQGPLRKSATTTMSGPPQRAKRAPGYIGPGYPDPRLLALHAQRQHEQLAGLRRETPCSHAPDHRCTYRLDTVLAVTISTTPSVHPTGRSCGVPS